MKKIFASLLVASAITFGLGQLTAGPALAAHASKGNPGGKKCSPGGYKQGKCVVVPASGTYGIGVATTTIQLQGKGSALTKNSQVTVWPVKVKHSPKGMQTFKVFVTGKVSPLKLTKPGKIYRYDVATSTWVRVKSITKTGIYGVVYNK